MTEIVIPILTSFIAFLGFLFFILLWSNAGLKSTFDKFSKLRIDGKINNPKRFRPATYYKIVKRLIDFTCALFALVILSPIMLLISLLIRIGSKGPIFTLRKRIGINGKLYYSIKFRTIYDVTENELSSEFPMRLNPRIISLDRFLSITSLDYLPEFFNVLKGDMSIVGRSRILDYEKYAKFLSQDEIDALYSIKPGITSLWAISRNKFDYSFDNIYDFDMYYMTNLSLFFDLRIFLGTLIVIFGSTSQE